MNLDQSLLANQIDESYMLNTTIGGSGVNKKLNQTLNPESSKHSSYNNNFTSKKSPQGINHSEIEEILKNVVNTHEKSFQKNALNMSKKYEIDFNDNDLDDMNDETFIFEASQLDASKKGTIAGKRFSGAAAAPHDKKKIMTQTISGSSSHSRNKSMVLGSKGIVHNERTSEEKNNTSTSSLYLNQRRNSNLMASKKKTPVKGSSMADSGVMAR